MREGFGGVFIIGFRSSTLVLYVWQLVLIVALYVRLAQMSDSECTPNVRTEVVIM